MNIANYYHLSRIIGPLNTVTDKEVSHIKSNDDAVGIRQIIRQLVRPEFQSLTLESQLACKNSMRYFLSKGNAPFYDIIDEQLEWPIEPPTDPKQFFHWVWEELFPDEDFEIVDEEIWEVRNEPATGLKRS